MANDKRIPELPLKSTSSGSLRFPVWDPLTDITYGIDLLNFLPETEDIDSAWDSETSYPVDFIVAFEDQVWVSQQANNLDNPPFDGSTFWTLGVKAKGGLSEWEASIFTQAKVTVMKQTAGIWRIYRLDTLLRPFNSIDFDAELAANDWVEVSPPGVGLDPQIIRNKGTFDASTGLFPVDGPTMINYEYTNLAEGTIDGVTYYIDTIIRARINVPGQVAANWRPFF